jgi:hypothetical protein
MNDDARQMQEALKRLEKTVAKYERSIAQLFAKRRGRK